MSVLDYRIRHNRGHYEAVDACGQFICSGDTWEEVESDIIDMVKNMVRGMQLENSRTRARTSSTSASYSPPQ